MSGWNELLFLFINPSSAPSVLAVELARLIANSPIVVGPALLIALWVWGQPTRRGGLLAVAMGMLVGLGINQLLGLVYFEPRPFMIGIGHTLLTHPPDNSFPSDHATFIWALGVGLITTRSARRWGMGTCLYGTGVAWSRINVGVHFPLDVIASMLVAIVSGGIARFGQPIVTDWILPLADGPYELSLHALRVPAMLIPRPSRKAKSTRADGQAEA